MIKANELRIGNWYLLANPMRRGELEIEQFNYYTQALDFEYSGQPIPLTEQCLLNYGFVADRNGWHLPKTKFSLTDKFYPCWFDRMLWPQDINDFKELRLEYVHHLQNLYFALTGQELEVKEKTPGMIMETKEPGKTTYQWKHGGVPVGDNSPTLKLDEDGL